MITDTLERARSVYDRLPPRGPNVHPRRFQSRPLVGLGRRSDGARLRVVRDRRPGPRCREVPRGPALVVFPLRPGIRECGGGLESYGAEGGDARLLRTRVYEALFLVVLAAHRVPLHHPGWAERTVRLVQQGRGAARRATLSPPTSRGGTMRCVRQPRGERFPRRAARGASVAGVCLSFPLPSRPRADTTRGEAGRAARPWKRGC